MPVPKMHSVVEPSQVFTPHCKLLSHIPVGVVLLLMLSIPVSAQRGVVVLPQNLGDLAAEASVIVRGHVTDARVEPHPDLKKFSTVLVTLRVEETLKGNVGSSFTFRQFIWDVRDRYDAAGYRKGQHLLLLLTKPSRYGLSSPVGFDQGRFRIVRDATGKQLAIHGYGNVGLFRELAPQLDRKGVRLSDRLAGVVAQPAPGPVPLDDLGDLIRQIVGSN